MMPQDPALSRKMDKRSNLVAGRSSRGPRTTTRRLAARPPKLGPMEFLAFAIGGTCLFAIGAMVFAAISRDED